MEVEPNMAVWPPKVAESAIYHHRCHFRSIR